MEWDEKVLLDLQDLRYYLEILKSRFPDETVKNPIHPVDPDRIKYKKRIHSLSILLLSKSHWHICEAHCLLMSGRGCLPVPLFFVKRKGHFLKFLN